MRAHPGCRLPGRLRLRSIQRDVVDVHRACTTGGRTAFTAHANRDLIHIRQVDTLIGDDLQRDHPSRPAAGQCGVHIRVGRHGWRAGRVRDRYVQWLGCIGRTAAVPERQFGYTFLGPVARRRQRQRRLRIGYARFVGVKQRHRLGAAMDDRRLGIRRQ